MSLAAEKRRKAKALEEAGASLSVKLIARSTRGRRVTELKGEDAEADETFWGQGAWQVDDDSDFSTEEGLYWLDSHQDSASCQYPRQTHASEVDWETYAFSRVGIRCAVRAVAKR